MEASNIEAFFLRQTDYGDPLNGDVAIGVKAIVDGQRCGWKVSVRQSSGEGDTPLIERAIAELVRQILVRPHNAHREGLLPAEVP